MESNLKMHSVAFTLSIIQPRDVFLLHQKARFERRFRHMSHHFLLFFFFFLEWNKRWWKAAILLFTLECVLLSRRLLNSAMAGSSAHICYRSLSLFFFFLSPSHPLWVLRLPCHLPLKGVCHFCLMCGECIKQSVTSTWGSTNVHMPMNNKIRAPIWITLLTNTSRAYVNIYCALWTTHLRINNTHTRKKEKKKMLTGYSVLLPPQCLHTLPFWMWAHSTTWEKTLNYK